MDELFRQELIDRLNGETPLKQDELLEILLENAYGGRDMSDIAKKLTGVFPSLNALLTADYQEIVAAGVPDSVASYIKTLGRSIGFDDGGVFIKNTDECFALMRERLKGRDVEFVELYLMNKANKLVEVLSYTSNFASSVNVSVNEVLSALSTRNVHGLYLAHNHIGCDVKPSGSDDIVTQRIMDACRLCGIRFFDHCIINTAGDTFSYKQSGRLPKLK